MARLNRKQFLGYFLFLLFLGVTRSISVFDVGDVFPVPTILGSVQTSLYMVLIAIWHLSVRRRIVQPQIRFMLECVSGLMIFWHLAKGIKYHVVAWLMGQGNETRYLWYLYYLPLLLIPALLVMIAFSLRKPHSFRLPKKAVITLICVSLALFLCVITNDLHQLVFKFPENAVMFSEKEYSHNILYYICFGWIFGSVVTFFLVTLKRCRLPNKKFMWLPLVPIGGGLIYSIIYGTGNVVWVTPDYTTTFTFTIIIMLECVISVGLIPSNSRYAKLFSASDRSGVITDKSLRVIYRSKDAQRIEPELLQRVIEEGSVTREGKRINYSPISGGYIFWKDDITKLLEINEMLEGTKEELQSYGSVLEEENKQKKRRQRLIEQQGLYENIRRKTLHQQGLLSELALRLQETTDKNQAERLLHKITVVGAYVKRRSNLCLLASKSDKVTLSEVELCIKESVTYLKLSGITAAVRFELAEEISHNTAGLLYDFFESAVEQAFDSLTAITVLAHKENGLITLQVILQCDTDLNILKNRYPQCDIEKDGEAWFCSLAAGGGVGE